MQSDEVQLRKVGNNPSSNPPQRTQSRIEIREDIHLPTLSSCSMARGA